MVNENSKQPARYIKTRMGNDLKQKNLAQNGILTEVETQLKSTVADCPKCKLVNCIQNKFCSSCSYPLTPSAFEEIKVAEELKMQALQIKYETEMKSIREEMHHNFKQIVSITQQNAEQDQAKSIVK